MTSSPTSRFFATCWVMVEPPCGRPGSREVGDEGADQAALVDALVLIEALVLGRDERLLHVFGNVGQRHPYAALVGSNTSAKRSPLPSSTTLRAGQLEALELVVVGQVGGRACCSTQSPRRDRPPAPAFSFLQNCS